MSLDIGGVGCAILAGTCLRQPLFCAQSSIVTFDGIGRHEAQPDSPDKPEPSGELRASLNRRSGCGRGCRCQDKDHQRYEKRANGVIRASVLHAGARKPGERSHSLSCDAASAWRAFRTSRSRSTPGGVPRTSLRNRCASTTRRCSSDRFCMTRCLIKTIVRSFRERKAKAQLAFSSPIKATDRAVMMGCALFNNR